jgi:two-component sensor histidine kinase
LRGSIGVSGAISADEARRLAALHRYDVLDTPPDGAFDRVTAIAARLFAAPIAIVSLVDHDRIWFKSHHGLDVRQIDRAPGLCASAILQDGPWVLGDARTDPRALANPLVAGEFGLRFYAGCPLRTWDGYRLGTLCVIDREPRRTTHEQLAHLADLAAIVMDQMELRRAARAASERYEQELAQKEVLLRELHHRVKNNLQVVSSLMTLQAHGRGAEVKQAFASLAPRIQAMSRLHEFFYLGANAELADMLPYLRELGEAAVAASSMHGRIALQVAGDPVVLPLDAATPLALIVAELVTNACKHGFPPDRPDGSIGIVTRLEAGRLQLAVRDDGVGMKADRPGNCSTLGLKLVSSLAQQLGAEIASQNEPGGGFVVTLTFSPPRASRLAHSKGAAAAA